LDVIRDEMEAGKLKKAATTNQTDQQIPGINHISTSEKLGDGLF